MIFDAILDKYGEKEGLTLRGGKIIEWPYDAPIPSDQELITLEADYKSKNEFKYKKNDEFPKIDNLIKFLWADIDSGKDLKLGNFYLAIKAIYDKYPEKTG